MLKTNKTNVGADAPVCPNLTEKYKNIRRGTGYRAQESNAITLIALVITIIILIILAGVTLNLTLGENGIFNKSKQGVDKYEETSIAEALKLAIVDADLTNYTENKNEGYFSYLETEGYITEIQETASINNKDIKISSRSEAREETEESKGKKGQVNTKKTIGKETKRKYYLYENGELYVEEREIIDLWDESGVKGSTVEELIEEGKLKIGQYVNYPVKYDNVATYIDHNGKEIGGGYYPNDKYANKWRIISIDEETNEVKLISAGVPLNYYHNNNANQSVTNLTTDFFKTEIKNEKPEQYKFFKSGFKGNDGNNVTTMDEVKQLFNNEYTKKREDVNETPEVRSITKEDFDKVAKILLNEEGNPRTTYYYQYNKYYEKNEDLYDLLIVPAKNDESGSKHYSSIWLASSYNNRYLWYMRYNGEVYRNFQNYIEYYIGGVRPVVTLESNIKFTQANSNEKWTTTWDISAP